MSKRKYVPRRGDVISLDFDPQVGHEQAGRRPALVLSPTDYNRQVGLVVICPITNQQKGYPWEVAISPGEFVTGVVLSDQIKNVDWRQRGAEFLCTPSGDLLAEVLEKTIALIQPEETD